MKLTFIWIVSLLYFYIFLYINGELMEIFFIELFTTGNLFTDMIDWLIEWVSDFNGMSTRLEFLCQEVWESRLLYIHIYKCAFKTFFSLHTVQSQMNIFDRSAWLIEKSLTSTKTSSQTGPREYFRPPYP